MNIVQGVDLHLIKTDQFKTNYLTFRFSGKRQLKNLARRALVAQLLATANATYPTSQAFREKLASLYGAELSTRLSTKGQVHMLDINISFVGSSSFVDSQELLVEIFLFLKAVLFKPLITVQQFQNKLFDLEKENLINYLESDKEDRFYHSYLELNRLYFQDEHMQESKYGSPQLIAAENSYTAYQEFQRMLKEDKIDLFLVGDCDAYTVLELVDQLGLQARQYDLTYYYQQDYCPVVQEKLEKRFTGQSILELAYHVSIAYGEDDYYPLLVFNGLLGAFSHSCLFTNIRENLGLAYSIGSHLEVDKGLLTVYTGIDKKNRQQVLKGIAHQLKSLKLGQFSNSHLQKTKAMLINNAKLAADNPYYLIDQIFQRQIYGQKVLTLQDWITCIEAVKKEDIVAVGKQIKLQSVYFLEGE